ncbi:unnamed protein product [Staurois parvus]|uniref:Uncharacterized protein n=1 Tax=Staurois parvus TaxID=386267 RepID=A0ABN9B823_9NEOB|nr:unnamed protein product [Staurois parvus]
MQGPGRPERRVYIVNAGSGESRYSERRGPGSGYSEFRVREEWI